MRKRCCRRSSGLTFMRVVCSRRLYRPASPTATTGVRRARPAPENRRADADHGRAFLDGDFEVVAHAHRQLGQHRPGSTPAASRSSRTLRELAELGPRAFGIVDGRREQHQPGQPDGRAVRAPRRRSPAAPPRGAPCLVGFAGQIDLDEQFERAACRRGRLVDLRQRGRHRRPSESRRTAPPPFAALFDCRWPMRCQRSGRSAVCVHLLQRFLDFVLAEVDLPGVGGGADVVGGEGLGDGDEADGGGVAPGPAGGARDAIANVRQPGRARSGTTRLLLRQLRDQRLRRRGVRPVRRELQVRVELGRRRSASLPSFTSAIAELVVRLGVVRIRRDRRLELLLRVGDLAGVPEDDALVVERVGVAAAPGRRAGRRRARSPSRWPRPPRRTSAARCRRWPGRCRPRRSPA